MPETLPRLRARAGNVLVKPIRRERRTAQGLIVPYQVDERAQEGEVISMGDDVLLSCKPGDIILYLKLGVDDLKSRDRELLSVPRRWVMGHLRDKDDYLSIVPFNRILVEMVPVTEDYRWMWGMKSGLLIADKKSHYEPQFRRGTIKSMDEEQNKDRSLKVGDVVFMAGHAGITLDGEDVEDQPLYGVKHRWLKWNDLQLKMDGDHFYPMGGHVLVEMIEKMEERGFLLPEERREYIRRGRVLDRGEEVDEVKFNDVIIYDEGTGMKVTWQNKEYVVIREKDILVKEEN